MVRKGSLFPKIFILSEILPGSCRKEFSVPPGQFLFPSSELFVLPCHHRRLIPEHCREELSREESLRSSPDCCEDHLFPQIDFWVRMGRSFSLDWFLSEAGKSPSSQKNYGWRLGRASPETPNGKYKIRTGNRSARNRQKPGNHSLSYFPDNFKNDARGSYLSPGSFSAKRRIFSINHLLRNAFFLSCLMDHDLLDQKRKGQGFAPTQQGTFPLNILERSRDEERDHLGHLPPLPIFEKDHGKRMGEILIEWLEDGKREFRFSESKKKGGDTS